MKKFLAFTLAETLIVMGVIGIVAAITLPNLNSSTGDKEKVTKVKKIYQNLNDAFGRAVAVYGPYDEWFVNDTTAKAKTKRITERLTEFMKVTKVCDPATECFVRDKKSYDDSSSQDNFTENAYGVVLADGTSLLIVIDGIYFDLDGKNKGKNLQGLDIFYFEITKSGIETYCTVNDCNLEYVFNDADGVTDWIIKTGNMDYLKADSKGKCPNGTQLSETVTSCK